jgi:hypothetical protein
MIMELLMNILGGLECNDADIHVYCGLLGIKTSSCSILVMYCPGTTTIPMNLLCKPVRLDDVKSSIFE